MSVTYCFLLFIVFISLLLCDGRHLGEKKHAKKLTTSSTKIAENMSSSRGEKNGIPMGKTSPKEDGTTAGDLMHAKSTPSEVITEAKGTLEAMKKIVRDYKRNGSTRHSQYGSDLVSVSWRVPKKKPSEKHPGFNSDYSPPKTHPPSHN